MISVFDVLDHLQRPEDQLTWIGTGASDALRNFDSDPEQYTSRKARGCCRLGYYLMKRIIEGRGLPGEKAVLSTGQRIITGSDRGRNARRSRAHNGKHLRGAVSTNDRKDTRSMGPVQNHPAPSC